MDNSNLKEERCYNFSVRIYKLCRYLQNERREYIITNQLFRSGTSISANIAESKYAQSTADYISKHQISLKEASESRYWIKLLYDTDNIIEKEYESLYNDVEEIIKILSSIICTLKDKEEKKKEDKKKGKKN